MILGDTKTSFAPPSNKILGVYNMGIHHDFNLFCCQSTFSVDCENEWNKIIKLSVKGSCMPYLYAWLKLHQVGP